jgi:hypothetical protein
MGASNPELPVQSTAVDTHCHLFLMDQEPAVAVEAAKAARVERMICVGVDVQTSERSIQIASELDGVRASAGIHPHDADTFDDGAAARIETLLKDPSVVGVGSVASTGSGCTASARRSCGPWRRTSSSRATVENR